MTCWQIESLRQQINDICWSPMTSSVFASVAQDGRIEIWDLTDHLTPKLANYHDKKEDGTDDTTPRTVVKFSETSPVLFTGKTDGTVHVYRTHGLEHGPVSDEDQMNRIMSAI
jgi:dynein intermediate chain 4, axonemal